MLKDQNKQEPLNITLNSAPNPGDLQHIMEKAESNRTKQLNYSWPLNNSNTIFCLTIFFNLRSKIPTWQLNSRDGNQEKQHWRFDSNDLMLIFNLITSSCEELENSLRDKGLLNVNNKFNNLTNNQISNLKAVTSDQTETLEKNAKGSLAQFIPTSQANTAKAASDMSGNLTTQPVANLVQSINSSKMTGKLVIESSGGEGNVYFDKGQLVHAVINQNTPEDSLFFVLNLKRGNYYFFKEPINISRTITLPIDLILMKVATLIDQNDFISSQKIGLNSVLAKKYPNLSEADFEKIVKAGVCDDLNLQKTIYLNLDNAKTLENVINLLKLSRPLWIPVIYNLLKCDIIYCSQNIETKESLNITPKVIDRNLIQSTKAKLSTNNGILTYSSFLYFLDREIQLCKRYKNNFSITLMHLNYFDPNNDSQLGVPPKAIVDNIINYIAQTKRSTDLLASYELFDHIMLLPFTNSFGTSCFCQRLVKNIYTPQIISNTDPNSLIVSLGIVSCPSDFNELDLILGAAVRALQHSIDDRTNITNIKDLYKS